MSNHNFEDRFFKTRRILELTIFFFLAFSLLSFSYSDFVPITKKVIYDINPNITVKPYVVDRTPLITYKDAETFRAISRERAELVGKVFFKQVYLKDIVLEIEEDHPLIYDLDNNVVNKKLYHKFSLLNYNDVCNITGTKLICNFESNFNSQIGGQIILGVGLESLYDNYSESVVTINVLPAPELNTDLLTNGSIVKQLVVNTPQDYDLRFYVLEFDDSKTLIKSFTAIYYPPGFNFCVQFGYNVNCKFGIEGIYDINFGFPGYDLNIPFKFNVLSANQPPKYIENSLPVGKTIIGSSYHEDFNMLELFEDEDSYLNFESEPSANCSLTNNIFSCDFLDHGYTDIRFKASDDEFEEYSPYYRVALLNESDIEFIFDDYNKDSFKVVNTQAFDLPLKLKGLNFDVYDLNISINNDLGNNQTFDFNLPKDENIEFVFEDLNTTTPGDYNIIPVINTKPIINSQINVLSIANNAASLKEYFEIYPNVLGDYFYDDDNNPTNDYVPAGIKFVLPFAIENKLNVDVQVEQCFGVYKNGFDNIYSKIDNNFIKSETKSICYNNLLLAKEIKNIDSIIELNLAEGDGSAWKTIYYDLKYNGIEFNGNEVTIFVENDKVLNKTYEYLNITDRIIEPSKGFFDPFYTNYPYTLDSNFSNGSVYEFLDINVCLFTAIYDGDINTYINTNIENKYGFVSSPNCYVVSNIKYNGLNNKTKLPTFGFNILDNLTLNNEEFAIIFGYYKNKEFTYPYKNRGKIVEPVNGIFNFGG